MAWRAEHFISIRQETPVPYSWRRKIHSPGDSLRAVPASELDPTIATTTTFVDSTFVLNSMSGIEAPSPVITGLALAEHSFGPLLPPVAATPAEWSAYTDHRQRTNARYKNVFLRQKRMISDCIALIGFELGVDGGTLQKYVSVLRRNIEWEDRNEVSEKTCLSNGPPVSSPRALLPRFATRRLLLGSTPLQRQSTSTCTSSTTVVLEHTTSIGITLSDTRSTTKFLMHPSSVALLLQRTFRPPGTPREDGSRSVGDTLLKTTRKITTLTTTKMALTRCESRRGKWGSTKKASSTSTRCFSGRSTPLRATTQKRFSSTGRSSLRP